MNNCLQDSTKITATRCAAPITDEAFCFVSFRDAKTTRGCITSTRELQSCSENSENCKACPVSGSSSCNSYAIPTGRRKCIHCNGMDCNTISSGSLYCANPDDSCVSINNFGNQVQGCLSDMTENSLTFCNNHKHSCTTCKSNDCNTALPKSPEDYNGLYQKNNWTKCNTETYCKFNSIF